jgi:hypothetical protein
MDSNPRSFYPDPSVSAAFRTSVAAYLHPYSAQICTLPQRKSCKIEPAASGENSPHGLPNAPWVQASTNPYFGRRDVRPEDFGSNPVRKRDIGDDRPASRSSTRVQSYA